LCETQEEIDYYTDKLSAHPDAEQCGWIKDKYGLSWQITSAEISEMFEKGSEEQIQRVTKAVLGMRRIDLKKLEAAFGDAGSE
jgi:predicted 3-demethylubiquinone-9 3-methyltransferase (glyoxalase superfamily)